VATSCSNIAAPAAAAMTTGACVSAARSAEVMTKATDPSVSWQESNRRIAGSASHRDA
jgi:hypothetical protein